MSLSRRTFGKLCAGGLVVLATSGPAVSAAAVLASGKVRSLVFLGGADRECRTFVSRLVQSLAVEPEVLAYDAGVDEIEAVRSRLADLAAQRDTDSVRKQFVAGLVGTHAYSVLESQLRDVGASLIVRGLHVRRRGHERHEFLTAERAAGVAQTFAALLTDSVDAKAIQERCLATQAKPMLITRRARGSQPTRLDALARLYGGILATAGCESAETGLTRPCADGPLNHESFIFSI